MAIGKRLRFEIFKRDGFRCRYCGANAVATLLHVDHVIAVAEGGGDDPENLVTACADCNLGKSSVSLGDSRLQNPQPTDAMLEHAEQMRAYLAAARELDEARDEIVQAVVNRWAELVDRDGMPESIVASMPYWIEQIGLDAVLKGVGAVARKDGLRHTTSQRKYFLAVLRNTRDGR